MSDDVVRVKIKLNLDPNRTKQILKEPNFSNFWYTLDPKQFELVDDLKYDLVQKIFIDSESKSLKISIDGYEVPSFETTSIFRQNDLIQLELSEYASKKRKINYDIFLNENKKPHLDEQIDIEPPLSITKPFQAALIGSFMVKHIDPTKIFKNKKCFFKSISGGRIADILEFIKKREGFFSQCEYIVITIGSNDCDSYSDINQTIERLVELAQYINKTYPKSILMFNELVPRCKTKYVDLDMFEKRRVCFNNFLNTGLKVMVQCKIITHKMFEIKDELESLLSDGVHLTPIKGIPVYVQDINDALGK